MQECVIIDLETTGLDHETDDIIEVAALKVKDGVVIDTFSSLIHREGELPEIITQLTGITSEALTACTNSPTSVMKDFYSFVGRLPMIGHNIVGFDSLFLRRYYKEYLGERLRNPLVDTLSASYVADAFAGAEDHKLVTLAKMTGADVSHAHRALDDCMLTLKVAQAIFNPSSTGV